MSADLVKPGSKKKAEKKTQFEFFAPQAKKVAVAGTFNGWDIAKHSLKKSKEGYWKGEFALSAGRHEYRYWVDGLWENDQKPVECVPNAFGSWNCVIEIK